MEGTVFTQGHAGAEGVAVFGGFLSHTSHSNSGGWKAVPFLGLGFPTWAGRVGPSSPFTPNILGRENPGGRGGVYLFCFRTCRVCVCVCVCNFLHLDVVLIQ